MTDLKAFLAFYKKIGIGIELVPIEGISKIIYRIGKHEYSDDEINDSSKFNGYTGFYSDIEFTKDGEFIRQGFWE